MFKSFREFVKSVGFGVNDRQLGFAHPVATQGTDYTPDYNSNDDIIFNAYLKDGSIHKVRLADVPDYLEQNEDKILRQTPNFRRPRVS